MPENVFINYENRLVAFLDVMGFKKLLSSTGPGVPQALQNYYQKIFQFLGEKAESYNLQPEDRFKKLLVSDSIIMSVVIPEDEIKRHETTTRFFLSISLIQYLLAVKCDIWTRGAVSCGNLCIDEDRNILVGPSFVSAYELEKVANYPRIIIDPKVCRELNLTPNGLIEKVNHLAGKNILSELSGQIRFGRGVPSNSDAIFIDWFGHSFGRQESLNIFFEGLKDRMTSDQHLFEKSQLLGRYLRESWDTNVADSQNLSAREQLIDDKLNSLEF